MATATARDLADPCRLQKTRGKNNWLNRLKKGDTPRPEMTWPYEVGVGPPEGRVVIG